MTKAELDPISNADMHLFFEKDIRGRVCYISKYIVKPKKSILDFKIQNKNQGILDWTRIIYMVTKCLSFFKEVASNGYILRMCSKVYVLEIDLEYPKELCELHNDYPLAPDEIEIKREMLPSYQLSIANLYNIPIGTVKKLVPNFFEKEKHALHYENLQLT